MHIFYGLLYEELCRNTAQALKNIIYNFQFMNKNNNTGSNEDGSDITPEEKAMLDDTFSNDPLSDDNTRLKNSQLDNTDNEGELLNEHSSADDASGDDLDIPGAEDDDADEMTGDEDEENNGYSVADTE